MNHPYHLVDMSKHPHDPKHYLKRHIYYKSMPHELRNDHVDHHVGYHDQPHTHKISIHGHGGHYQYYDQNFPSRQEAESHVRSHFKFTDAFPKSARAANHIYENAEHYASGAATVAAATGHPEVGAGIQAVGNLVKNYREN
jgi:hypothetical protein